MDTKIRCLLVDDELPGLNYLKMLCQDIPFVEIAGIYNRPEKVIADKDTLAFDLCLFDIEMPGISGMELARILAKPVIFTTAYKDYAAEAFDINAIDYLVKPISISRLRQALDKAQQLLRHNQQPASPVLLNTDRGKALIDFNEVVLITTAPGDPRDKLLLLEHGAEVLLKNYAFDSLKNYTQAAKLQRVNKKQMIALRLVSVFTNNEITLKANELLLTVPLNAGYRNAFLQAIAGESKNLLQN